MKTLVTVPHSECIIGLDHLCDYLAPKAGRIISDKMNARLFLADNNRTIVDYNRKYSRDWAWRKQIRDYVSKNKIQLVLDIHSYPNQIESFGTIGGMIPDVVILDSYGSFSDKLSKDISDYLNNKGVLISLIQGSDNDISIEMRELGIKSLLIEFNERLKSGDIEHICDLISSFFSTS